MSDPLPPPPPGATLYKDPTALPPPPPGATLYTPPQAAGGPQASPPTGSPTPGTGTPPAPSTGQRVGDLLTNGRYADAYPTEVEFVGAIRELAKQYTAIANFTHRHGAQTTDLERNVADFAA